MSSVRGALATVLLCIGSSVAATPDTTEPATSDAPPVGSTVESTPGSSVASPGDSTTAPAGDSGHANDDDNSTLVALGIVGFVVLLAVAAWWMVRRDDPDRRPLPTDDGWSPGELP